MNLTVQNAIIAAEAAKDKGYMANLGAYFAGKRNQKKHLRTNHLGKFRKGKK